MEMLEQTRFEQVPLAVVLKIVKEQAKRGKAKVPKKIEKKGGGNK